MKIVKAEILWSRTCPLSCSYCAMADGRKNTPTLEQWIMGFEQLRRLGCSFAAFYGAEPLHDFDKLPEVIRFTEGVGIHTTVITSGVSNDVHEKIKTLYDSGLRSLTMSYDRINLDSSSQAKTSRALGMIDYFRSLGPVRDVAVVVTLSKKNFKSLPSIIKDMSHLGIWTFFDLIHPDRGQLGSKVKNTDSSEELYFTPEDYAPLIETLDKVQEMKKKGFLCHASHQFIETLKIVGAHMQNKPIVPSPFLWNCAEYDCFPSWVTVDCDGAVYPCDDFQIKDAYITDSKIWNITDHWKTFCHVWRDIVLSKCPGCLWNTHIDAHLIKRGLLPITDYIHGTGGKL